ncbi:MAG TPA: helicase-related protein [Thermotogota bacterium]|nr:helicase-related protein [Thermotogota bacterium]
MPPIINNTTYLLKDDLIKVIRKDSKVAVAAATFSMFVYSELREQLRDISEFRFIFTSPSFTTEKASKAKREFFIPQLNRERSLHGTEYEIKLRNELTQKSIARECAEWIRKKARFKTNTTQGGMGGFLNIDNGDTRYTYLPITGFTTVELGSEKGNMLYTMINRLDSPGCDGYFKIFRELWKDPEKMEDVTEQVIENISTVYRENPAEYIYFLTLFNIFNEFLEDIFDEDTWPNEATGFKESAIWNKLYPFQKDAAMAIISKLEKFNGCILADSVGLGKTYTALAVIKYYENRNKSVLVLCPRKLEDNWNTFKLNLVNNPIHSDRLRYDVLFHTDLSRTRGTSNGIPLDRFNWSNYDLVVIDESHNFRNGGQTYGEANEKENRYLRLLNKVVRAGVKTKVLMLSATPVNNRFYDLRNQLALAYEGEEKKINSLLSTTKGIDTIFRTAQAAFNGWSKMPPEERTTQSLLEMLDFDFFELLDSVTIARSRTHITRYYNTQSIGSFPKRNPPITKRCSLSHKPESIQLEEIYKALSSLNLAVYTPSNYILDSKRDKYNELYSSDMGNTYFHQVDREQGIMILMRINLLKRLESSVQAFRLTLQRVIQNIEENLKEVSDFSEQKKVSLQQFQEQDLDVEDLNTELFSIGQKVQIDLADMDYLRWKQDLKQDHSILSSLLSSLWEISPEHDLKLQTMMDLLRHKINNPINPGNRKMLIFSAFADTVSYLYEHLGKMLKEEFGLETAMVTGSSKNKVTTRKVRTNTNDILTCFSPLSKDRHLVMPDDPVDIDLLIATDCISEGQNLQDCDTLVNYDIHWNPVRIIQRFGRIDRIGSHNQVIQLVNFWPDMDLDEYIQLKARVETRMKATVLTSTGDDNPIEDEHGDLEYRKLQLERLQTEVVDIEEMSSGVSIMDLGLNEFRTDLIQYTKIDSDLDRVPHGLHTIVPTQGEEMPPGVIFVLKNLHGEIDQKHQNRLHPFYLVYIADNGEVIANHLEPKKILDTLRFLCAGRNTPEKELCSLFNRETEDGRRMQKYSELLQKAIASIIEVNEESEINSLFKPGGTSALTSNIRGLDDFELISFVVVR